ncbi:TetR/AcrR family transcriptional regulator [Rhodococcus jostii]|uniref:DNA-binding transcriptional regulator, AcrR family n=1 Tax=Rhodococcus jostii TaxID=132919 RepID=A0A1H4Y2J2_RHOJO|nr:TetR/AcrR family transcriptional regulator [Rhodococcus jostii]SED11945.1 DNA-binding transcriptional regulator, AcrR family [Rhodococcus jostii]
MARRKTAGVLSQDADVARSQILVAAQTMILRFGISKTTMEDIAKEAGVSRPTVYRYFQDRETLTTELIRWRSRQTLERGRKFLMECATFEDRLIEGLIYLVYDGINDPIVRILVSPEHVGGDSWLETIPLATSLTTELWGPIFDEAKSGGEMRADIDTDEACSWITLVQLMLAPRLDNSDPSDPAHRQMMRQFVLPAFLP